MASTPIIDDHEMEIHTSLYENVFLLSIAYDNPVLVDRTHLQDHLRPDMFIKPNKFLFEQIIYNLLTIINPDYKKKITWPLYEKKMESQFRNDIKEIINTLHDNYPEARIPVVQTSHMIFPGNSKCIRLLWYLSELAILQSLRRFQKDDTTNSDTSCLQLPFNISSTDDDIEKLQLKLQNINCFVNSEYQNLIELYTKSKEDVIKIRDEANEIVLAINELQRTNESYPKEIPENIIKTDVSVLNVADFQSNLAQLQHISETIESLQCFLHKFTPNSEISTLKFSDADEQLDHLKTNYSNIINETDELKLIKFFEVIDNIFKQYVINFELFTSIIDSYVFETKYSAILNDYIHLVNDLVQVCKPKLLQMNNTFQKKITQYNQNLLNTKKMNSSRAGDKIKLDQTSELNFNISFSNQKLATDKSYTTTVKRQTILETLTTLKKQQRPMNKSLSLSEKKSAPNARRNIIPLSQASKNVSPVVASLLSVTDEIKSSSTGCTKEILTPDQINENISLPTPSGNSTPITSGGTLTNTSATLLRRGRKSRTSEIQQLLFQNSTPPPQMLKLDNAEMTGKSESPFNISTEIINLLLVDDDLDASNLIFNISKN